MINILRDKSDFKPRFQKFGKLPGKPSALIRIALKDLEASEKMGFKVEMSDWLRSVGYYQYDDMVEEARRQKKKIPAKPECSVCFAGSVMACSLNRRPGEGDELMPNNFPDERDALMALNDLRTGDLRAAFNELHLTFPEYFKQQVKVIEYEENPKKFKKQMADLADALEAEGY